MSSENNDELAQPPSQKRNNTNNSGNIMSIIIYAKKMDSTMILDSESDVNNDHLIGNVQRVAIVPPNYEGKPKKGHLIFDASFECGTSSVHI